MKYFAIAYFVAAWKLSCKLMLNIALLLHSTAKYSILFFAVVKYNNNDSYSSPVALNNDTVAPNNGTIAKRTGVIVPKIFTVANPLFSVTNHSL